MDSARGVSGNVRERQDGSVYCVHCDQDLLGDASTYLERLPVYVGAPRDAGPHIYPDPHAWIDADVVFRQRYCPHCWTALHSEVVPA